MSSKVPGTSGQQSKNDATQSEGFYGDKRIHNISVQTGEEFSAEFLRDRATTRRDPVVSNTDQRQSRRVGFDFTQNQQLVYEDLTSHHGIKRIDSENISDYSNRYVMDGENRANSDEANFDRACLHQSDSPLSYQTAIRFHQSDSPRGYQAAKLVLQSDSPRTYKASMLVHQSDSPHSYQAATLAHQPDSPSYQPGTPVHLLDSPHSFSGKIKFLCSFGGRILPRPSDGKLRYVGGETRIISIRQNLMYNELVKKTSAICSQTHTIKYQLPGEDLDALISVCSDEDLHNMIEEYHDLERGSQRLRIFLVPSSDPESPCSFESRNVQQSDADYQYVVAVNGMLDPSPRKSSSRESLTGQASQWGNTSEYSPTFQRESPTPFNPQNMKHAIPSAPYFNAPQTSPKAYFQSPLSQVPYKVKDLKNSHMKMYEDRTCPVVHECNSPYMDRPSYNNSYRVDATAYNCNHAIDTGPVVNSHQQDVPNQNHEVCSYNCHPGAHLVSATLNAEHGADSEMPPVPSEFAVHSHKFPSSQDIAGMFSGSNVPDNSHQKMSHVLSDSEVQYVERPDFSLEEGMTQSRVDFRTENSPSLAMPSSSQKWTMQQEYTDEKLQVASNKNHLIFKIGDLRKEHIGWGQDMRKWTEKNDACLVNENKDHELNDNMASHADALEHKTNLPNIHLHPNNVTHLGPEPTFVNPDNFTHFLGCKSNRGLNLHGGETLINEVPIPNTAIDAGTVFTLGVEDPSSDTGSVSEKEGSRGKKHSVGSNYGDAVFFQSQSSDRYDNSNEPEFTVIVEDVTDRLPPDIPLSSTIVPLVQDEPSDGVLSTRETESGSVEDAKGDDSYNHKSFNDAAIAEVEAGIYGLQIIRNADLEELQELGSGTFGTVYHGKWRGTDVAIKRIKKSCFSGRSSEQERLTKEFWREAQILSKLHHPNVVAFYGVVPDGPGGTLATVTEFMIDGSLRHVLRKDRVLDRRKKLIIVRDAAFGMEYLHLRNIVHFDLKCDNLLVNLGDPQRPVCKVGDFGLSRIKRNTLVSGGVRGTLPWMAPELLNGSSNRVSEKVDVFSFGITMWEILTGEEPYANMHCGAIIGGIVNNTLRPPIPERCDPEWRKLMEDCWSPDPSARPSFTEITNRLGVMSKGLHQKRHNQSKT
ncbi:hypothetical protein LguiB_026037 [Lonicera macranthoides]